MEQSIAKLIRILDGKEGPKYKGSYVEDARYTYPDRIALAREVAVDIENFLTSKTRQPDKAEGNMKKPEAFSARDYVDDLPYIGEYFQPDDSVYRKASMDEYIKHLEVKAQAKQETKEA